MIGRDGLRRVTVLNPARRNVETVPVKTLELLPDCTVSRQLTPTHGPLAIESEQTRRGTLFHDPAERATVLLARPLVILTADPPVHAPAAVTRAALAEQVFKSRPKIGRQWADGNLHHCYHGLNTMRIAILSDIHGNRTAFEAVLKDLREASPDLIFHGGDLADGGSSPVEIIDQIRDFAWQGVVGNTDEMLSKPEVFDEFARQRPHLNNIWTATREMARVTREWLGDKRLAWLRGLPFRQVQDSVHLVHAHPETCWTAPGPDATDTDVECYSVLDRPIAAYGHIHLPYVRKMSKLIVANSGSVGMPFDGDQRASYLLIDGAEPTLRRVEYDVDREIKALMECGLPHADWIARMLSTGSPQLP